MPKPNERAPETEEGGPVQDGIWDTRTKENCFWCAVCQRWIRPSFPGAKEYHQEMHTNA